MLPVQEARYLASYATASQPAAFSVLITDSTAFNITINGAYFCTQPMPDLANGNWHQVTITWRYDGPVQVFGDGSLRSDSTVPVGVGTMLSSSTGCFALGVLITTCFPSMVQSTSAYGGQRVGLAPTSDLPHYCGVLPCA